MIDFRFVEKFIGFLEKLEYDLISWGFYDSSFSISEIQNILEKENYLQVLERQADLQEKQSDRNPIKVPRDPNMVFYSISSE